MLIASDLDNDGDQDVLAAGGGKSHIIWHENLDALGNTSEPVYINLPDLSSPIDMITEDMDGDGDNDLIIASLFDKKVYFLENGIRAGEYGNIVVIAEGIETITSIHAGDMDGDGIKDVLLSSDSGDLLWYKNNGNKSFGAQKVIANWLFGTFDIYSTDLDGDGDEDVLSCLKWDNKIAWFENLGNAAFGPVNIIDDQQDGVLEISTFDMDNDGDQDILSVCNYADKIAIFRNEGNKVFSQEIIVDPDMNSATIAIPADLDNDGDLDIIASAWDALNWYENTDGKGTYSAAMKIKGYLYLHLQTFHHQRYYNTLQRTDQPFAIDMSLLYLQ